MKLITSKDGDLLSCFDKIIEINVDNTSLKQILFNNHKIDANRGKIKGYLELEHIFDFCRTFERTTQT